MASPKQSSKDKTSSKPKKTFKDFTTTHSEQIKYVYEFAFTVIVYGILLNIIATTIFSAQFAIKNILALGIAFYFIKEELPRIINRCIPRPPKNLQMM